LDGLKGLSQGTNKWIEKLRQAGLEYLMLFPCGEGGEGILAWGGKKLVEADKLRLAKYRRFAADLFENAAQFEQAEIMSYTDALTGLANQRYMYKRLEEEINRSRRYSRPLAFVIFDIDDLKTINDTYGHQAGDALLKQVGQALKKSTRAIDIIARYGGDEFCVVMPESDEETSVKFMRRMLETIAGTEIRLEGITEALHCSVSMGGALFPKHAKEAQKLVYAADMALLQAKEKGRNRFLIHSPLQVESAE
jgi:diguanylate cyclase (GGDEF)-like protein